jgi:TolB-like protein
LACVAKIGKVVCYNLVRFERSASVVRQRLAAATVNGDLPPLDLAREAGFALGRAQVSPATREVVCGESRELLEPRVMQVLVTLYRRRGTVVSRDELIARCWGGRVVGDDAVNRTVGRIRRLGEHIGGFTLETIPRVGHRLWVDDAPAVPPNEFLPPDPPAAVARRRWPLLVGTALLAVAAVVAVWFVRPPSKTVAVQAPQRLSIAVLPFTPLYNDPEAQNFGDSIATVVADTLSSGTRFSVIAPAESFRFRGAAKAGAATALGVDFIIDGELKKTPDGVAASVRLIDGHDGTTLRTATLHRTPSQAGSLADFTATEVAGFGWVIAFGFGPNARWDHRVMAAHLQLLNLAMSTRDPFTAYGQFRRVAEGAPQDAFAQMDFGATAALLVGQAPGGKRAALVVEARAAADKAIRLDPAYGDPYAVLYLTTPIYDWNERERLLRKCLAIVPESLFCQGFLIEFLQNMGRMRDAGPLSEDAYAHAPYQDGLIAKVINARIWLGRPAEARPLATRATEMFQRKGWFFGKLFEATAFDGDLERAEALLKGPIAQHAFYPDNSPPALYALVLKALRQHRPADAAAVAQACAPGQVSAVADKQTCLLALSTLWQLDAAFKFAAAIYPDQRAGTMADRRKKWLATPYFPTALLFAPATARLRSDPRFADIVERTGLVAYWKSTGRLPDFCAAEKAPVCATLN